MHVLVAAELDYIQHLEVMMFSLLLNGNKLEEVFLISEAEEDEFLRLAGICSAWSVPLRLLRPGPMALGGAPRAIHGIRNISTYYRLLAGQLLPAGIDRVLYLDADLIIRKSLAGLWAELPPFAYLAAATLHPSQRKPDFVSGFGGRYFNAGVLNINLAKWREDGISARCLAFLRDHPERVRYHDQCVLNHVCRPFHEVGITWNFSPTARPRHAAIWGLSPAEFEEIARDPAVFHFIGQYKPWHAPREEAAGIAREYFDYADALERWLGPGWARPERARREIPQQQD